MKNKFCQKLFREFQDFRNRILEEACTVDIGKSDEMDMLTKLYKMLMEKSESLPDEILESLLEQSGLLENLYQRWLKQVDTRHADMSKYMEEELHDLGI